MGIILMMIIERPNEVKKIKEIGKWILIYGRRKTGKTFLVQQFIAYNEYFFIKTNKSILTKDNRSVGYETFLEILRRELEANKTVVVDEFHRLDSEFFDFLHSMKKSGKLILISSTLSLSKKLISNKSALLGIFAEIPMGIISLKDALKAIAGEKRNKKEWLELALLIREPIAIDYINDKKSAREIISLVVESSIKTIPALVGEIFTEEAREISAVYEGIMRGIATGKIHSGELSSYLFSKKVIKKDDPSIIQQYLNNLISFGIIKRIGLYNKKRFIYKLASPLSKIYYYADEKYNLSEKNVSEKDIAPLIDELIPRLVEDAVREALAEKYGLRESIFEDKDYDIDGVLLKFKKPEIAIEVKWKNVTREDINQAEETLGKINVPRKIIFVPDKNKVNSSSEVIDVSDLV